MGSVKLLFQNRFVQGGGSRSAFRNGFAFFLTCALALAGLAGFSAAAAPAGDIAPSAEPASHGYENLREAMDVELQQQLRRAVRELHLDRALDDKRLSIALVDVTDERHPRLAMLNGDEMMYAASLPKIAILFGAYQKAHEGRLPLDDNLRRQMVDMIRYSSNEAATYVLNRVGRSYLTNLLQSRPYRFYDTRLNGGLWVGKAYASGRAYQRDPLHDISHGATAYQVARFLYLMETNRLVSPEYSREMKDMMGNPGIHHKFVKGLEESRPGARIYRKSGTWREYHADGAIVEREGRRYIAAALAEDRRGGEWMRQLIVAMDDIVFSRPRDIQSASLGMP